MISQIRQRAKFECFAECKRYLFPTNQYEGNWLTSCFQSISPLGDIVVLASGSGLVVLKTEEWSKDGSESSLEIISRWQVVEPEENISCVAVLPIVSNDESVAVRTCVAVGFDSGYFRVFSTDMKLLKEEVFRYSKVLRIKAICQTLNKIDRKDTINFFEAVNVVYGGAICYLDSVVFSKILQLCYHNDKVTKSENSFKYSVYDLYVMDACVLRYPTTNYLDFVFSPLHTKRPSSSHIQTVVVSTSGEWFRLDHVKEEQSLVNLYTSVTGLAFHKFCAWYRGKGSQKPEVPALKPAEQLYEISFIREWRGTHSIVPSPDGSLVAIPDSLGRVAVGDVKTGHIIRLLKGHRSAQCAFLKVEQEVTKRKRKDTSQIDDPNALDTPQYIVLLAIYTPSKGLIEFYPVRYGTRVASLQVSKNGHLIYNPYHVLGQSDKKTKLPPNFPVLFFCQEGIMDIIIPFHCAFVDESSILTDRHIYKQLRSIEKKSEEEMLEEVLTIVKKLQTDEMRLKSLTVLATFKFLTPKILLKVTEAFLTDKGDEDTSKFIATCCNLRHLLHLLTFLNDLTNRKGIAAEEAAGTTKTNSLSDALLISEAESSILLEFTQNIDKISYSKKETKVKFEQVNNSWHFFIKCFNLTSSNPVECASDLSEEDLNSLGVILFTAVAEDTIQIPVWKTEIQMANLSPSFLIRCLVQYWFQRQHSDLQMELISLRELIAAISTMPGVTVKADNFNMQSQWWSELREILADSVKTMAAFTFAICCRAVSIAFEQDLILQGCMDSKGDKVDPDWENVSADTWEWDLLIARLEDVVFLNAVLQTRPLGGKGWYHDEAPLNALIAKGEGAFSELVAKWLCQFNLPPLLLVDKQDAEFLKSPVTPENLFGKGKKLRKGEESLSLPLIEVAEEVLPASEQENCIIANFHLLKKRFPYSLTSSVILSYMGLEQLQTWQLDISQISFLVSGVEYLKTIPSSKLKVGMCVRAWKEFFNTTFLKLVGLFIRFGKISADTLSRSEIPIKRQDMPVFLKSVSTILDTALEALVQQPCSPFNLRRENIWQKGPPGLISETLSADLPVEQLLDRTLQIAIVLHMTAELELEDKQFASTLRDFSPHDIFGTHQSMVVLPNLKLSVKFFCRAVSAAVQTKICLVEDETGQAKFDAQICSQFMQNILNLAPSWKFSADYLRRHYVCELYSCGYDRLAEETLPAVVDTITLASQLLVIVGHRIKAHISSSPHPEIIYAELSPRVSTWLSSLKEYGVKETQSNNEDIQLLLTRILQWLPENNKDFFLADCLKDSKLFGES